MSNAMKTVGLMTVEDMQTVASALLSRSTQVHNRADETYKRLSSDMSREERERIFGDFQSLRQYGNRLSGLSLRFADMAK